MEIKDIGDINTLTKIYGITIITVNICSDKQHIYIIRIFSPVISFQQ